MVRIVHIKLTEKGGFVPRWSVCELNMSTLPSNDAVALQGLIAASGILETKGHRIAGASDIVEYTFEIETSEGTHVARFDGPSVPESVRPLLRYLMARSHDMFDEIK